MKIKRSVIEEMVRNVLKEEEKAIAAKKMVSALQKLYQRKIEKQLNAALFPIFEQFHKDAVNMFMKKLKLPEKYRNFAANMVAKEMEEWGFRDLIRSVGSDIVSQLGDQYSDEGEQPEIDYRVM